MDSLTQGLLGATTFAIIKDKEIGKQSLLIGAIAGTIPDLDVFFSPFFSDIEFLTVHRSVSHSIVFAVLLSIGLGTLFHRWYKKKHSHWNWILAFFLAIMTHSLLDWCTTYGTKLFSPFNAHLFSTNNIHVFDPIYTLVLLTGVIALLFKNKGRRQSIIKWTLVLSTIYILWTFASKGIANKQFVQDLEKQNIEYEKLIVSPTPFNSILWHGIAKTKDGFYIGTYSLLDKRDKIDFQYEASANEIIEQLGENRLVKYYLEYTQGFPLIKTDNNGNVKIYAIKYGPINFYGVPEFIFPLSLNDKHLEEENIKIDFSNQQKGPVKNFSNLIKRIKGI